MLENPAYAFAAMPSRFDDLDLRVDRRSQTSRVYRLVMGDEPSFVPAYLNGGPLSTATCKTVCRVAHGDRS